MSDFPRTINELFNTVVAAREKDNMLQYKREGVWRHISLTEMVEDVKALAAGLHSLGVRVGDRVGLLSENRPEWVISDLGILGCGAADVLSLCHADRTSNRIFNQRFRAGDSFCLDQTTKGESRIGVWSGYPAQANCFF